MKCLAYSEAHPNKLKKFMVTSGTKTTGNTEVPESLRTHSHEEADTLLILHALTVDKDAEVTIDSPDTDIFLLLIHKCHELRGLSLGRESLGEASQSNLFMTNSERNVHLQYSASMHSREVTCPVGLLVGARTGASRSS